MDVPYSQQQQARRKNRSAANLQHLTLAPLTPRLPLRDDYDGDDIINSHAYFSAAAAHGSTGSGNINGNGNPIARIPSYIQGRSAPTTPRLLSKSPTASRSHSRDNERHAHFAGPGGSRTPGGTGNGSKGHAGALSKSLSTTHLHHAAGGAGARQHRRRKTDNHDHEGGGDDWLFRAAVLVTSEARESKGQSWLTARASSISLSGLRSAEEAEDVAAFEHELAREREMLDRISGNSRRGSRRSSLEHDVTSLLAGAARGSNTATASRSGSRIGSRANSRMGSRANSRVGSRIQLFTPLDARRHSLEYNGVVVAGEPSSATGGYFDYADLVEEDAGRGTGGLMTPADPDFVNLDEQLEAAELHRRDTSLEDEDQIRRLVKREKAGGVMGSWLGSVFGWSLFDVQETEGEADTEDDAEEDDDDEAEEDEDDEDDDNDDEDADSAETGTSKDGLSDATGTTGGKRRRSRKRRVAVGWNQRGPAWATSRRRFEGDNGNTTEDVPPPPRANEGTWQDAAWLLSVASKVIL
ncbi:hypothetical protein SCUCBS95973_008310 [Sporothrix curviconia]|uniref:Uncharacterized protein n=1 Tax=Sporothrix curviconia TaxID=1260050 RepID=A0ABP0CMH3_9PEZI